MIMIQWYVCLFAATVSPQPKPDEKFVLSQRTTVRYNPIGCFNCEQNLEYQNFEIKKNNLQYNYIINH